MADAAQTLGMRTLEPERLKELLEGKFVDALRTAAAEMTMEELHEKRGDFVKRVRQVVAEDLRKNGLELEAASLTQLDQTAMEFFNPSNAFDAEGLTRLTEQIERRKKQRNDVEQDTMISIRSKNLEAEKLSLDIDREAEYARLTQEREVEVARAQQRTELARERSTSEREVETSQISAREAIEKARIATDRVLEEERISKEGGLQAREIERRQNVELAEQQRSIAVSKQSKAESEARAAADQARAKAVTEEERVFTARETEMAERRKQIDLIEASKDAQREGIRLTMAAEAEKTASADRGHALRAQAQAEADSDQIRTMALRIRHEIEAEGARLMNETHNMLTPDARTSQLRLRLIDKMEGIIRESVKPMERIEGIKILHVDGLGGGGTVMPTATWARAWPTASSTAHCASARRHRWSINCCARSACRAASSGRSRRASARPRCRAAAKVVASDSRLHIERHRRAGRRGLATGARLQRPAGLAPGDRRVAHRSRRAIRSRRLRAQLPHARRRRDPRTAADAVRLRIRMHVLDSRITDGRR